MKHILPDQNQKRLTEYLTFTEVKLRRKCLTPTDVSILNALKRGDTQKTIAERLSITRSAVCQRVKKLANAGFIIPPKTPKSKLPYARGAHPELYDVRWRSLKWKLAHQVKLPYDGEPKELNGLTQTAWKVKHALIRQNTGKNAFSLEIEAGFQGGRSLNECERKHDEQARAVYRWLCDHFPELAQNSGGEHAYEINRPGELNIRALKSFAERVRKERGGGVVLFGEPPVAKADDSLKNGGELQFLLGNIASKKELADMGARMGKMESALTIIAKANVEQKDILSRLAGALEKLLGLSGAKPEQPPGQQGAPSDVYR